MGLPSEEITITEVSVETGQSTPTIITSSSASLMSELSKLTSLYYSFLVIDNPRN
jgi:hypothetical protein